MPTFEQYVSSASEALAAGFASEAARKRANENITRAYDQLCSNVRKALLDARGPCVKDAKGEPLIVDGRIVWPDPEAEAANSALYWSVPSNLPKAISRKHDGLIPYGYDIAALIELRAQIKAAEIIKVERPEAEIEAKSEQVRKSITEWLEARKASYVETLDVARLFNGLPVTVTAHYVHGHKGGCWLRHFYYVRGKLTALQVIMAAAVVANTASGGNL